MGNKSSKRAGNNEEDVTPVDKVKATPDSVVQPTTNQKQTSNEPASMIGTKSPEASIINCDQETPTIGNEELNKLVVGKLVKGKATINYEEGHETHIAPSTTMDDLSSSMRMSSSTRSSTSTTAGVMASGSGAAVTVNNPSFTVRASNDKTEETSSRTAQKIASPHEVPKPTWNSTTAGAVAHHGGQMTFNTTNNYGPPSQGSSTAASQENQLERILKRIHENTWNNTHTTIGETFPGDTFPEPLFQVHPQMATSPNFFQGGHEVTGSDTEQFDGKIPKRVKQAKYKKDSKFTFEEEEVSLLLQVELMQKWFYEKRHGKSTFKQTYKKDRKFTFERGNDPVSRSLSFESLMKMIHKKKDKLSVLGVVAQAGAGKTTCMRRWARHTMELSGMTKENGFECSDKSRFKLVHYIDLKSIESSQQTSLQDILFKGLFRDKKDIEFAYDWLIENQNLVAIFMDGLDQAAQIMDEDKRQVADYDTANSTTLLYNLFSRKLLPRARIILSSREHSVTSLPKEAWMDDVVTLTGFSKEDAKKLFNKMTTESNEADHASNSDNGGRVNPDPSTLDQTDWDKLAKTSPALIPFVSIPIFLLLTAVVYKTNGSAPSNVTDLMSKVIESLKYSLNIKKHETIETVINKLKRLSHEGMVKGLVMFSMDDLDQCDLTVQNIQDLLLMVCRSRSLRHRLIEGDNVFFFCHQILQEFLSACFIVEMSLSNFKKFVREELSKSHWSVVRRFVCGLVFGKSQNEKLLLLSDIDKKQDILRKSLISRLKDEMEEYEVFGKPSPLFGKSSPLKDESLWWKDIPSLELCAAIHESSDYEVNQHIPKFILKNHTYSDDALRMVGSLMARCERLDMVQVVNSDKFLPILTKCLKDSEVQINQFRVRNVSGFFILNRFLQKIKSNINCVIIGSWNFPSDEDYVRPDWTKIQRLYVNYRLSDTAFVMDNRSNGDSIKIWRVNENCNINVAPENYFGTFNMKDATMEVKPSTIDRNVVWVMATAASILRATSVAYKGEEQLPEQLLLDTELSIFQTCEVTGCEVEEVKLHCMTFHEISKKTTSSLVRQMKVKILTLEMNPVRIDKITASLSQELGLLGCELRLHVNAKVHSVDDLQKLPKELDNHQMDHLRLKLLCEISCDMFLSFIKELNSTKLLTVELTSFSNNYWLYNDQNQALIKNAAKSSAVIQKIVSRDIIRKSESEVKVK